MSAYDPKQIEGKWQKQWNEQGTYTTESISKKPKCYILDMFPYPSGEGLHVGHPKGYIATDIYSRFKRMNGFNVLHPMGWDAFGLPAENYALKNKVHPKASTEKNVARYKEQLSIIGLDYDWNREINTTDSAYYKWTQWIFLQIYKKGLASQSFEPINWCPSCKTGLANEDLDGDKCERCGTLVEKKPLRQWVLKITDYADRLLKDIEPLKWPESIKELQRNWIGRSEGVNFKCKIKDLGIEVQMYNSVPQTYRAETFTVIAPEHPLVNELVKGTKYEKDVLAFVEQIKEKKKGNTFNIETDLEGIFTGRYIENYANTGRDLPIWVASYVLADYGTGMVNCSAHDVRDFAFAKKYNIPLHEVAEAHFVRNEGEDAFDPTKPIKKRNAVICIIHNPKTDKYLCLRWKKNNWQGFVIGGIEDGEDPAEAGLREIKEETGYQNVRFVKKLGNIVHSKFYQAVKQENRYALFHPMVYEVLDDAHTEINDDEKALHEILWLSKEEVDTFLNRIDLTYIWNRYKGTDMPIVKSGILIEPEPFKGREWHEVREDIIEYLVQNKIAERKVNYKLRDWVFARQRYWGEPIPMVFDEEGKPYPVDESELPVTLPEVESYEPSGTGESPLATITSWVNVEGEITKEGTFKTKKGGKKFKRETNTMPQWAGSSWYYLRFMDPKNNEAMVDPKVEKYFSTVDFYVGGAEHATRHLIYARFWHKVLYDIGAVSTSEPFSRLQHVGLIAGEDGRKMSKRYGNVVNPDDVIGSYGADSFRLYEMFMGPFDQGAAWSTKGIVGQRRFLERIWAMKEKLGGSTLPEKEDILVHKTIKKVTDDIENFKLNTAISSLMILINELEGKEVPKDVYMKILQILAPFAPHMADELWSSLGGQGSIHTSVWPSYDENKIKGGKVTLAVQVNGKTRGTVEVSPEASESDVKDAVNANPALKNWVEKGAIKRVIYRPNMIINYIIDEKSNN